MYNNEFINAHLIYLNEIKYEIKFYFATKNPMPSKRTSLINTISENRWV